MNSLAIQIDESLENWQDVANSVHFTGIVIGNGSSRNVWEGFAYDSLYEVATSAMQGRRLSKKDRKLFDSQGTQNFEIVLASLATARRVLAAFGRSQKKCHKKINERYDSIRNALVAAVKSRHIPWVKVPHHVFLKIKEALREYDYVYSTNYDLLIYWAIMLEDGTGFKDYFFECDTFDLSNTEIWDGVTRVVYLHGGLHLCKGSNGETIKKRHGKRGENLLDLFDSQYEEKGVSPQFVAEGDPDDKLRLIYGSDYLAFAYSQLTSHEGPLCIFGHRLGDSDKHIAEAITKAVKGAGIREIGVSIRNGTSPSQIVSEKARFIGLFPEAELRFFDSSTHPLGSPDLRIEPDGFKP